MKYYIAYGSNLNRNQMRWRCPDAKVAGTGWLRGHELLFKGSKTGNYLTVEHREYSNVPVAVWEVSEEDEKSLDRYEGYPHFYYKKDVQITITQPDGRRKKVTAFVYIMHEDRKRGTPDAFYWETCCEGYGDFGFNTGYLKRALRQSQEEEYVEQAN